MQKKTKVRIIFSSIGLSIVLFILACSPIAIAPSEKEIKETIEGNLGITLPDSIKVIKSEAFEAPIYQIQGIIRSEEVEIGLAPEEYEKIKKSLLALHTWKLHSGGSYSLEVTNQRERIYFYLPVGSERITYLFTYD